MNEKYIATATRVNIGDGKPNYLWVYKDAAGHPVLFKSEREAFEFAEKACLDNSYPLIEPVAKVWLGIIPEIKSFDRFLPENNWA
jgi:hypothetical protein